MIETVDLLNAGEVADLLGLSHREAVSTYRRRYPEFPHPVVSKGTCVLWSRDQVLGWDEWRRNRGRGPLVRCARDAVGWVLSLPGLRVEQASAANLADAEHAIRQHLNTAFAPDDIEPDLRLAEPTARCVYCGGRIDPTGGGSSANGPIRLRGRCESCVIDYRGRPGSWDLG